MIAQICVGSSCHLKGSETVVEQFRAALAEHRLDDEVTLAGCFCTGQCNRLGVTVVLDDQVHTGITPENFHGFFQDHVLKPLLGHV